MADQITFQKPGFTPPVAALKLMLKLGIKPPPPDPIAFPENWECLPSDEKYAFYKQLMLSTKHRAFESQEVTELFVKRTQRWLDTVDLKESDEVPAYMMPAGVINEYGDIGLAERLSSNGRAGIDQLCDCAGVSSCGVGCT
jgi:hypothetical protein